MAPPPRTQAELLPHPRASLDMLLRGNGGLEDGDAPLLYAYGALDVGCVRRQHEHEYQHLQGQQQPHGLLARLPLPACLSPPPPPRTAAAAAAAAAATGGSEVVAANLWLGANVTSRIHVDARDNLLCVAVGAKIVHLYSPFQLALLSLGPPDRAPVESTLKSLLFHTPRTWPPGLGRVVARVGGTEALFIPAGWAHEVFTIEASYTAAVSLWCESPDPRRIQLRPTLLHLSSGGRLGAFVAAQQKRGLEERGGREEENVRVAKKSLNNK
jgi:hypothetical protein